MNLHEIETTKIWILEYEDSEGQWQQYRFRGDDSTADEISDFMFKVGEASGGMISDIGVYELRKNQTPVAATVLKELHDLFDDYLEDYDG